MAYIGRGIDNISNASILDAITFTNSAGHYNLEKGSAAFSPISVLALVISVDGVIQDPASYTISAATITFGVSMASTLTNDFIVHNGVGLITEPSDGSVTAAKLATDAVETAKIKDLNVTAGKLAATQDLSTKTITLPASVSGLGTGITNAQLAGSIDVTTKITGVVPTANLGSGSASASTYLAGNQTYQTISEYNDDALQNDIATLALHQATNANAAKYNLTNTNVDVYQDSTGVATFTDCARNAAGEFVSSVSESSTNTAPPNQQISTRTGAPATSSWTGGGYTDDRISNGTATYAGTAIDFAWDLSNDFTINKWWVDNSGDNQNKTYLGGSLLITTDTSMTAGASPTDLWDTSLMGAGTYQPDPSDWADMLDSTYATAIGASGFTDNSNNGTGDQSIDISSTNAVVRHYWNSGTAYSGWKIVYTKSTATLTMKVYTSGSFTSLSTDGEITVTNVPSAGRLYLAGGDAAGGSLQYMATSYNGGSLTDYSSYTTTTDNATGNYVSTATVANASVSKVGIVITYKNNAGTNTLNTDIIAQVSADGGSNYSTVTLAAAGTFSTGVLQAVANDVSVTAGTSIQYKISFANQSIGVKEARITGASLIY